jgi:hypothetical protein
MCFRLPQFEDQVQWDESAIAANRPVSHSGHLLTSGIRFDRVVCKGCKSRHKPSWLRDPSRNFIDANYSSNVGMTTRISCPHSGLGSEEAPGACRVSQEYSMEVCVTQAA